MSELLYGSTVDRYSQRFGIPLPIARKLIRLESDFRPGAIGANGEVGLGQLKIAAAQDVGLSPADRFDPEKNIRGSLRYLARQHGATGSWTEALGRYNQGPTGAYDAAGRLTAKARDYVRRFGAEVAGNLGMPGLAPDKLAAAQQTPAGCSNFALTSPSTWMPALQCALSGFLAWVLIAALVLYAGIVAIRTGG